MAITRSTPASGWEINLTDSDELARLPSPRSTMPREQGPMSDLDGCKRSRTPVVTIPPRPRLRVVFELPNHMSRDLKFERSQRDDSSLY